MELGDKDYHYPDEPGAVMFALRHSRDLGVTAKVIDPEGNVVCQFDKRKYDVKKYTRRTDYWRNDELQMEIARSRSERMTGEAKQAGNRKRVAKKASGPKVTGKTGEGAKRTLKRR